MAIQDAPDGTLWTQVVDVVVDTPVPPAPAHEYAAGAVGRYSGGAVAYQTVATWTVTAARLGELKEIVVISDNYAKTLFQITVDTVTFATDWVMQAAIPLIFEDLKLAALKTVTVKAKSSDATVITVDAAIVGKETG